ncbi:uncharacterized protein LOC128126883 [Lactuca sativa]|uniref:uncharacterized protein LOC128126883 n=1 Tax=Lactuca sativa TaxID=4236 RepID=UPI0022AEE274|nr:uncharacterized protein LOC128126883 [Lactuca sativa]
MNLMNDIGDEGDDGVVDIHEKIHLDFWNESENKIRVGMLFENKDQVKKAVRLWSIKQNREFKVCESKSSFWIAKCKTLGGEEGSSNTDPYTPQCAWRKAIENIYGTWESNFAELPKYISTLQTSNPNTVVKWFHNPNGSSHVATFKYIFWAFGPAINAFHLCRPVISIDACHLRGSYKGKMLIAVTKDANNNILPVSYAIVDEETTHSWSWFLYQFRHFVAQDRQLCVISDRHQGIIHAMANLEEWEEPLGYHRFCLRHIRSNLMKKYKNVRLKSFCWDTGSTTQKRKFVKYKKQIKAINLEAWQKLSDAAMNCNTPLPSRMWRLFRKRDTSAQSHTLTEFNYNEGVYRIVTKLRINENGGNTHTISYYQHTCTRGKWQMKRFPCSHALAVCRFRGDNPFSIINHVYTTVTYKQ